MHCDLWQRRLGWVGLLTVILTAGGLAHSRHARADDAEPGQPAPENPPPPNPALAPYFMPGPFAPNMANDAFQRAQAAQAQVMQQMQMQQEEMKKRAQEAQQQAQLQFKAAQEENRNHAEAIHALVQNRLSGIGNETGKFWLGLDCKEASPELRTQLGLDEGQGLVVMRVAPNSPAEKADLKLHDVITSIDDAKLLHVPDLSKVVNVADGKSLELHLIRGGKEQLIAVTPAQRPVETPVQMWVKPAAGMVMPGNMQMQVHMPDNLQVSIQRKGNEPAKITVKRGEDSWEATADDLSKLPDDVRPLIEQMMGRFPGIQIQNGLGGGGGFGPVSIPALNIQPMPAVPGQPAAMHSFSIRANAAQSAVTGAEAEPAAPANAAVPIQMTPDVMKRLEQVTQQLQQTQAELQRLREALPSNLKPSDESHPNGEKVAK